MSRGQRASPAVTVISGTSSAQAARTFSNTWGVPSSSVKGSNTMNRRCSSARTWSTAFRSSGSWRIAVMGKLEYTRGYRRRAKISR